MRLLLQILLTLAAAALVVLSFLSLAETNLWWVRMTDFPRLQYAIGLIALLILLALARPAGGRLRGALAVAALAALGFNALKLAPYWPGERAVAVACPDARRLTVMVANVKRENRDADALLDLVRARQPDLLLALETNEWWDERLSPLQEILPHTVAEISSDHFGMHLFSALPLAETRTTYPAGQDAPSILTDVRLRGGGAVRFIGLHPRPPHPGQNAAGRDGELMWAALTVREAGAPAVLAGDFNAVPWERTVERAQRIGRLLDPRDVAGFLPSYDANSWWMDWPLDQVLYQAGLSLISMTVLPGFGSDHYPVEAQLCLRESGREPPQLRDDDLDQARTALEAARDNQG